MAVVFSAYLFACMPIDLALRAEQVVGKEGYKKPH